MPVIKNELTPEQIHQAEIDAFYAKLRQALALAEQGKYPFHLIPGIESTIFQGVLVKMLKKILNNTELKQQIQKLGADGDEIVTRLPRSKNPINPENKSQEEFLARIVYTPTGDLIYEISPKSKRGDSSKREMQNDRGANKVRKIAVVINGTTPELNVELIAPAMSKNKLAAYFDDIVKNNPNMSKQDVIDTLQDIIYIKLEDHQIEIDKQLEFYGKPGFAQIIPAGIEEKTINIPGYGIIIMPQVVILAPFKPSWIGYMLKEWKPENEDDSAFKHNLPIHSSHLLNDMFTIINDMHAQGKEHKDLKFENFLIDTVRNHPLLSLEVTDFGTVTEFGEPEHICGTTEYMPPWMIQKVFAGRTIAEIEKTARKHKDSEEARITELYAWDLIKQSLNLQKSQIIPEPSVIVNGKHDVWAMACIYYETVYRPKKISMNDAIQRDQLLQNLLQADPNKIPTAEEALQLYQNSPYYNKYKNKTLTSAAAVISQPPHNNLWVQDPAGSLQSYLNETQAQEREKQMRILCKLFAGVTATQLNDIEVLIKSLSNTNVLALQKTASNLILLCEQANDPARTASKNRTTDEEWATHKAPYRLALNIAATLACELATKAQNQQQRRRSSFFSCTSPNIPVETIDYSNNITKFKKTAQELSGSIKESLSSKSFVKRYGIGL